MNQITPAVPPTAANAYSDVLPRWLNYLIGAFPTANLSANTFPVFEDAFSDVDPATMFAAARAAVKDLRFFPTVHELGVYVRKQAPAGGQWLLPPIIHYRRNSQVWPVCPRCGERVNPDWDNCPACADLARMEASR